MLLDSRESRKRNCKLPGLRHGNLAISSQQSRQKTTLAQWVRNFFTGDLIVTPASSLTFSGPRGGPFSPARLEFRVSATTGIVNYSIRTPSWLTASSTFGTTDTRGVTITLTVNANASRLSPGAYGPAVAFTNVSNGQGSTTRPARLIVQGSLPSPATGQIAPGRSGGFLLDDRGGHLLVVRGGRLLAQ